MVGNKSRSGQKKIIVTTDLTRRITKGAEGNVTVILDCPLMPSSVSTGSLTSTHGMRQQHDAHHRSGAASYTGDLRDGSKTRMLQPVGSANVNTWL